MPIYMDVHIVPGVKAKDVAEAHRKDLLHQDEHGCKCMTYWIDEERENIFCLIEAPNKEMVRELHNRAHGLVPNKIIEVSSNLVQSFLGRIHDPEDAEVTAEGLKVFKEPSIRFILMTQSEDPVLLQHKHGSELATDLIRKQNQIVRKNLAQTGGTEVEQGGIGFVGSFTSASKAVECASGIQRDLSDISQQSDFRMSIHAGEPVEKSSHLFGDTLRFATHLCTITKPGHIIISTPVKDLIFKDRHSWNKDNLSSLDPYDEGLLQILFDKLEEKWQDADFNIVDYCRSMAMSQSQLYRKTISLTNLSPNILLKEYRLQKAKELMQKKQFSIAQITFESGFTSPSYFTKCFKKKYGMLPMEYIEQLG